LIRRVAGGWAKPRSLSFGAPLHFAPAARCARFDAAGRN
jgi:hypothetical protein